MWHKSSDSQVINRREALGGFAGVSALLALGTSRAHLSDAAQATPMPVSQDPTTYRLEGSDIEITYATTSFDGTPTFNAGGKFGDLEFRGEEITTIDRTPIGSLVTVPVDIVFDLYTEDLTLILPAVNLLEGNEPTTFSTIAVLTKHLTSIGGPDLIEGALDTYEVVWLTGIAEFLVF